MKKTILWQVLLIGSTYCFGKNHSVDSTQPSIKKTQLGIFFSPDYSYRYLTNPGGSEMNDSFIQLDNNKEIPIFCFTAGISFSYKLYKNISLESGLSYSKKGFQTRYIDLTFSQPEPKMPIQYKQNYLINYLDIPMKLNYTIGKKKIKFICSAGFALNIALFVEQTGISVYQDSTVSTSKNKTPSKKLNISPMINAGLDWQLKNQHHIRLEPTCRMGLLDVYNTPIKSGFIYSFGLSMGYYF